ncbi:MAG: hypothetical protein J6J02_09340 [Oscillospiraceae bacterium]|nr:hypothetical protein [Oscillospiraceae bacterium]
MRSLKTIQKLSSLGSILSKIAFVLSVVGFCGCIAGLIGLRFGSDAVLKLGDIRLHGLIANEYGRAAESVAAALCGWVFVCAGKAVLAKFAECYFKNELRAETPFTLAGAKELQRLGILALAIPLGSSLLGSIAEGLAAGLLNTETATAMDLYFDNEASLVLASCSCWAPCCAAMGRSRRKPDPSARKQPFRKEWLLCFLPPICPGFPAF